MRFSKEIIYSRELRNMVYFEVYRFNPTVYNKRRYVTFEGLVLSSFRPVRVLLTYDQDIDLRYGRIKENRKYVVFKSSSNDAVIVDINRDKVCSIYDRMCLEHFTSKRATIPERIEKRIRTLKRRSSNMWWIFWNDVHFYTPLVLLALYYKRTAGGLKLRMKMFRFNDSRKLFKFSQLVKYNDGLLVDHNDVRVFVPVPSRAVHHIHLVSAFMKLKYADTEEEETLEDLEEGLEEEEDIYNLLQDLTS